MGGAGGEGENSDEEAEMSEEFSSMHVLMRCALLDSGHVNNAWLLNRKLETVVAGVAVMSAGLGKSSADRSKSSGQKNSKPQKLEANVIVSDLTKEAIKLILRAFDDPLWARTSKLGLHWNGRGYKCVRADDRALYAKEIAQRGDHQHGGLIVVRTVVPCGQEGLLICTYTPDQFAAIAVEASEKFADYLLHKYQL